MLLENYTGASKWRFRQNGQRLDPCYCTFPAAASSDASLLNKGDFTVSSGNTICYKTHLVITMLSVGEENCGKR
jgi:hypothetical protein